MKFISSLFSSFLSVGIVFSLFLTPQVVNAEVFNVNNASDFQSALTSAQNNTQDDTINLAPGNYQSIFVYTPVENNSIEIIGNAADPTQVVLDGQDISAVLSISNSFLGDDSNATVSIRGITVLNGNSSGVGGGLRVETDTANITVENCHIIDNQAASFGGGLYLNSSSNNEIIVNAVLISGNTTEDEGGGAFLGNIGGNITVTNSIYYNNKAIGAGSGDGAGLEVAPLNSGTVNIINNTITENIANNGGGGLLLFANQQAIVSNIYNNIIYGNTANDVGGLNANTGDVQIYDDDGGIAGSTINLFNNNLSEVTNNCTVGCNFNQGSNIDADPLFVDPGVDFNLAVGSPSINTGNPTAPSLPTTDFLDNPRTVDDIPDMGALEVQPSDVPPDSDGPNPTGSGSGCALSTGPVSANTALPLALLALVGLGVAWRVRNSQA